MTASFNNELVSISEAASGQIEELRRLVEDGRAKLAGSDGRQVELPDVVQQLMLTIFKNFQAGKAVSIVAEPQELGTERAAHILGVSHPFLIRLLDDGGIPFHVVGSHREIHLRDLLAYKRRRDAARHDAIDRLAKAELADGTYDKVFIPEGGEEQ